MPKIGRGFEMMLKIGKIFFVSLMVILVLTLAACANDQEATPGVVIAEYTGGQVLDTEFATYVNVIKFFDPTFEETIKDSEVNEQVLKQFIGEKYLSEQFTGVKDNQSLAEDTFEQVKLSMITAGITEQDLANSLKDLKLTEEEVIDFIQRYYGIQDYFVEKKYQEDQEEFSVATVSHILIEVSDNRTDEDAKARAEEVLAKLDGGGDFAQLAAEYSDDPGSKDVGGKYENVPVILWVPEFKEAALTQEIGEVGGLVRSDFGYHIIKVDSRSLPELTEIDPQVAETVYNEGYGNFITNELPSIITEIKL